MKHSTKYFIFFAIASLFVSCNDDFTKEKLSLSGVSTSEIFIAPEWEADDYIFHCEGGGNNSFSIHSKPDWLSIDKSSGMFTNGEASIQAKAHTHYRYSRIGVYTDQIVLTSGRNTFAVPVYYIVQGVPSFQTNGTLELPLNNNIHELEFSNSGEGILVWKIASLPQWLTINTENFYFTSKLLGPNVSIALPVSINTEFLDYNNLTGTITLKTNDKNHPLVDITVNINPNTQN